MQNITEQLGGMQQVTKGFIQPGDKVTFTFNGERCIEPVENATDSLSLIGLPVQVAELMFEVAVYRKMPVAQQGDIDHVTMAPPRDGWNTPGIESLFTEGYSQPQHYIPQDNAERKLSPMFRGLIGYFPAALFEVARHSLESDKRHNPGSTDGPHWARGKSSDHADCILRHLIDAGDHSTADRLIHLRSLAWRSLALLQDECERLGAKPGVSSRG